MKTGGEKLKPVNPKIADQIREAIEAAHLDSGQQAKLQLPFYILTAEKKLRSFAKDVVWHFNNRVYKGKAMFIAMDKLIEVKMYNYHGRVEFVS